jgi:hypothetical protein
MISIRSLRLRGDTKDYPVSFLDDHGELISLGVIAGVISTGKTTVLQFIDYCLGNDSYPRHPEIVRRARVAFLEIGTPSGVFVIERELGVGTHATVHVSDLGHITEPHERYRRKIGSAGEPDSLSWFLLDQMGLAGVTLRQAPTKADSNVDPLSFRDFQRLYFLSHSRLDNGDLLDESHFMRKLKMRQVIDLMFGVRDDRESELGAQLKEVRDKITSVAREIESLVAFLDEHQIHRPTHLELRQDEVEIETAVARLTELDLRVAAQSDFLQSVRGAHERAAFEASRAASVVRDRSTLLDRLLPLKAQYSDDLKKLNFYEEAAVLFDPLSVTTCPVCFSTLSPRPHIDQGHCSLCGSATGVTSASAVDVGAERKSLQERFAEVSKYIETVEQERSEAAAGLTALESESQQAQARLDEASRPVLSPFMAERDQLLAEINRRRGDLRARADADNLHRGLDDRRASLLRLRASADDLVAQLNEARSDRPDRATVLQRLNVRFGTLLSEWRFPKLSDPFIDSEYVPHARGLRYSEVGSAGAMTLIALAWQLSIFETAIEMGADHPGFLFIDSPQKNLGQRAGAGDAEFADASFGERIYAHLSTWTTSQRGQCQVIVVDNTPPPGTPPFVVWFSRSADQPPYGLIDDEIG